MPPPNKLPVRTFAELPVDFQQHYQQLTDTVNSLTGHNGTVQLVSDVDLGGNRVKNLGTAKEPNDALASTVAEQRYSATALKPKLQPGGSASMVGYRMINNGSQREQVSSYMNDLMSSVPSANTIYPTITNSGGQVSVSIPAGPFTFADGSTINLIGRVDLLSLPAQYAIASISSSGTVITVTTSSASGLAGGQIATIAGVTPASFNGTVQLTSATPPDTLTYQSNLGTLTGSGGYVQTNGVWYYTVKKRSQHITILGPYSADTAQNRLQASYDGYQIVAVVVLTASGGQVGQSGGGGSPIVGSPTAGAFF